MPVWFQWVVFVWQAYLALTTFLYASTQSGLARKITKGVGVVHVILACLILWFIAGGGK